MMAGVLVTSIGSGQLISRTGRYRIFPIVGTALVAIAMFLLSRLEADTALVVAMAYAFVLGLGLGMVMQVLVLAAQNAVEYRLLGVATSGSTLFRQIGGSIGVAAFGAIFANRLASEVADAMPAGTSLPAGIDPAGAAALPPLVHDAYVDAFAAALSPVFLTAAVVTLLAFVLAWLLPELPLRTTAEASGLGESFASPRDGGSQRELERALTLLAARGDRWHVYELLAGRAEVDLPPPELWLLARLGQTPPVPPAELRARAGGDDSALDAALASLAQRGLVAAAGDGVVELTAAGTREHERLVAAQRAGLRELLEGWQPDDHQEVQALLDRLSNTFGQQIPTPPTAAAAAHV